MVVPLHESEETAEHKRVGTGMDAVAVVQKGVARKGEAEYPDNW